MIKNLLLVTITVSLLLVGCGKVTPVNKVQQDRPLPTVAAPANNAAAESPVTITPTVTIAVSDTIDYNQYIKKTWIEIDGTCNFSFCISKIIDGEIVGIFTTSFPAVPNRYDLGHIAGTIDKDTADCQFSDTIGNKGNIKLVFKPNNEMEATLKLTEKSQYIDERPQEGTFQFIPYNLNDIKEFSLIEDQSFIVDLDSWGTVNFVSGILTGGNHIPTVFYLTNEDGDILYDFNSELPYSVDVKAVSFKDVNKDGLKDVIIIVADNYGIDYNEDSDMLIATVYFQNSDGLFANDYDLDFEINESGNNKDIKTVTDYLSKKY